MAAFKTYEEIAAWAMGRELVKEIYRLTKGGAFKSTKLALRQIAENGYAQPYADDKRMIVSIGINYNPKSAELEIDVPVNVPVNVPVKLSTVTLVEQMIRQNPGINRKRLSAMCGLSEKTIGRQVKLLSDKVEFRGAPKTGGYFVSC